MIIMQHTSPVSGDTFVHDDGTIYTNGELNTVGSVEIVDGQVVKLRVKEFGVYDIDISIL